MQMGAGDMMMWIRAQGTLDFLKQTQVFLSPGMSIYWPFGYTPIIMGVAGGNEKELQLMADRREGRRKLPDTLKMATPNAYAVHLNLDMRHHDVYDKSLVKSVYLNMLACQEHLPKGICKWDRLKLYEKKLKAVSESSREGCLPAQSAPEATEG